MSETLATADSLIATQTPGLVTIKASGYKPTPAHDVRFQQTSIDIFPPQYRLVLIAPAKPSATVLTKFEVETSFSAEDVVATVVVFDSAGRHDLTVDQAQD